MPHRVLLDVHMPIAVAEALRRRGIWACPDTGPAWLTRRMDPSWGRRHHPELSLQKWPRLRGTGHDGAVVGRTWHSGVAYHA